MSTQYDLTTFSGRVGHLAQLAGGGAELSRRTGMSQSTLSRIIRGKDTTLSNMLKLCQHLYPDQTSLEWLLLGQGNLNEIGFKPHAMIRVPIYAESKSNTQCPIQFEAHWFQATVSRYPNRCIAFQALDSEILCIERGAWIIIDTGIQHGDGLYLISIHDAPLIRRLQFMPTGEINVRTNGEAYKNYMLNIEEQKLLEVLGRVVWWEHR